jgi:hypothetical protein
LVHVRCFLTCKFFYSHLCDRMSKKRLETIASAGNPTVTSYEHEDDNQPLDENQVSDAAIAQDLDEIEAAAYIKMREELGSLNKANETYHKNHATLESAILFAEVGIRRNEASANDFQVRNLNSSAQQGFFLMFLQRRPNWIGSPNEQFTWNVW